MTGTFSSMNGLKFAIRQLRKNPGLTTVAPQTLALSVAAFFTGAAFADLSVREIQIAPSALTSRVPEVAAKGRFIAPQAISAVDNVTANSSSDRPNHTVGSGEVTRE